MTMQVANEILSQLGGKKFLAMTGAKNLSSTWAAAGGLQFSLPRGFAKDGINKVVINLTPRDDYIVTFYKIIGTRIRVIAECDMVYVENLREVFTDHTGLCCTL